MNLIQTLEAEAIAALSENKKIPAFRAGDTVKVGVKVIEGERTRIQNYEGVCIARSNKGMGSNFTVRKMSFGEGVERVFPLYSPNIDSIGKRGLAWFTCNRNQGFSISVTCVDCTVFDGHSSGGGTNRRGRFSTASSVFFKGSRIASVYWLVDVGDSGTPG